MMRGGRGVSQAICFGLFVLFVFFAFCCTEASGVSDPWLTKIREAYDEEHVPISDIVPSDINPPEREELEEMTSRFVKNPTSYWQDSARIQRIGTGNPLWTFRNPMRFRSIPRMEQKELPPTSYPASEIVKEALQREKRYVGEWLGVGADLPVPRTSIPPATNNNFNHNNNPNFVETESASEKRDAVAGQYDEENESLAVGGPTPSYAPIRHQVIKIPQALAQKPNPFDPMLYSSSFPKMEPPPPPDA